MRLLSIVFCLCAVPAVHAQAEKPPVHVWLEPEWFEGVKGAFNYWTGTAKPIGSWGIAGPGISAEWTQGGESEWNSMGVVAEETKAECQRDLFVPRAGNYKIWVRYVDHRKKAEPFRVLIEQGGKEALNGELGIQPIVPANDEFQLWWGFSFGWGALDVKLQEGPARLKLRIDKAGQAWRQLDAVLLTDDLRFIPQGREKPRFVFQDSFALQPKNGPAWRGAAKSLKVGGEWKRPLAGGKDFSMWLGGMDGDPKWWAKQDVNKLTLSDLIFQFGPPTDIREKFHKQFAGRRDLPVMSFGQYSPGMYLGTTPDLSPGTPLRQWLQRTKSPFFIMTNYASGSYTDKTGPATYEALTGPLAEQFLGYIHGEALGTGGVSHPHKVLGANRRQHVDAFAKTMIAQQAEAWSKIYKTKVSDKHMEKSISCLSVDSIALCHLFQEMGCHTVGYELDATNAHVPMRIAFERGAARQYGHGWINYASGNFGDSCNYFTQQPTVPRGAPAWFHSKYAITDGVSAAWYRKLYYLNYMGGAAAIYWEQNLTNQWILPGPGEHPIQLSPFGRGTEDFQSFVTRLPDRGEPFTPIALLLNYGHSYERVNNYCKMLDVFQEDKNDLELRELFNVCWHPIVHLESQPAAPDVQSMPSGVYGDIFDVLVDRPARLKAILNYPVVWAAGDADLSGPNQAILQEYLQKGGTLVATSNLAKQLPPAWLGYQTTGKTIKAEQWNPEGEDQRASVPAGVEAVTVKDAKVLAWAGQDVPLVTRQQVGDGAVVVVHVPNLMGLDERAHPCVPWLMNGLTQDLAPVEVRLADGKKPGGEIHYQFNRTKDGWLVTLMNHRGIDKTQNGLARVDRRQFVDVVLRTNLAVQGAKEWTEPRDLTVERNGGRSEVRLRVHPGDVQVVGLAVK